MTSGRGGSSNFVPSGFAGDFGWEAFDPPRSLLWRLWPGWSWPRILDSRVRSIFLGSGRIVSSWGSISDQCPRPLIVSSSPSKLESQFSESSRWASMEANAFSLSPDNKPPKLSCPFICGRCRAVGEMVVAKSLSQLSSSADVSLQPKRPMFHPAAYPQARATEMRPQRVSVSSPESTASCPGAHGERARHCPSPSMPAGYSLMTSAPCSTASPPRRPG